MLQLSNKSEEISMRLSKIKLHNYRCFGSGEQVIPIDDVTAYIGNNSTGKTAALSAINCMFSSNGSDRVLKRSDFHLPMDKKPDDVEKIELYIEAVFTFEELGDESKAAASIPTFFQSFVVDEPEGNPYLRIRLEATWEKSSTMEGAVECRIWYINCSETEPNIKDHKHPANRRDLDRIRVIYVPAVRDPSKQLKNASGSMLYPIMNSINWSDTIKENVEEKIKELNAQFLGEKGISILGDSICTQWKSYDWDQRYSNAILRFNSTDIDSCIKKSEVVFLPTPTGKESTIDDLSDGLRSLFYISLVDSLLDIEMKIQNELENDDHDVPFSYKPPYLTIIALEEPENHIAPHLIGNLFSNIERLSLRNNAQTILSSHSTAIIKRTEPDNIRYFRLSNTDYTTEVHSIILPDKEKLSDQYKYIKEAVKAYPELYFANLVILGEGDSEEIILPKFWIAKNGNIDTSGISIVPLGGRHVNHFWRLLNDLSIPHITLLDLDKERDGGGWGRIKYVLDQLIHNGFDRSQVLGDMSAEAFEAMNNWDFSDSPLLDSWLNYLEKYHVFFSAPLDIDFLMLEHYTDIYKGLIGNNEGPYIMVEENGEKHRRTIRDIEEAGTNCPEYKERVENDIRHALKEHGGDGITYTEEQQKLMVWYTYFFLNRGKPSTHIEALSKIDDNTLTETMPSTFERLFADAENLLSGEQT